MNQGRPLYQRQAAFLLTPERALIFSTTAQADFSPQQNQDWDNLQASFTPRNPVDLTTGRKLIPDEVDFSLPGLMPIEWSRFYASDLSVDSVLGRGWVLPWEQSLRRRGSFIYLTDNQGREIPFVTLQPGERIYNPHEQVYLVCTEGGHYLLQLSLIHI